MYCSIECGVKLKSRYKAEFNTNVKLLKQLDSIQFHMQTFYKHSNNEYRPLFLNARDDYCKSFQTGSALLNLLLRNIKNNINFNKPCPWTPGDYFIKDFNFGMDHLPNLIPDGLYILNTTFYRESNMFLFYAQAYFHVTNRGILDLNMG